MKEDSYQSVCNHCGKYYYTFLPRYNEAVKMVISDPCPCTCGHKVWLPKIVLKNDSYG